MATWLRLISLIGMAGLTSSCDLYFSKLEFLNRTDSPVVGLTVFDGQKQWTLGDLVPNGSVKLSAHLSGDAEDQHVKIAWIWHGRRYWGGMCYFTSGTPTNATITIVGTKLEYNCR